MIKKEFLSHLLLVLVWLFVITLLRWSWHFSLIWLWLGGILGMSLLDLDHLFYIFVSNPHELTSLRIKRLVEQKRLKGALILTYDTHHEREKLAFRNALFQAILYVLCFFVLTSTNNLLGSGLVMGMALHLLEDEIDDLLKDEERLKKWLFWPLKIDISWQNQKFFVILMLLIFLGLNLLLI